MKNKKGFTLIEVLVAVLLLGIVVGGVWVWRGRKAPTVPIPLPSPRTTIRLSPTLFPSPIPAIEKTTEGVINWKIFESESPFYRFSVSAPADSKVYFSPTASTEFLTESKNEVTIGDEPWITGVFLTGNDYPYGLVISYTTLSDQDARSLLVEEYNKAMPSDIDFGAEDALMMKGSSSRLVRKNALDKGEVKEFLYTKYIFRNGDNLYVVNIQTDLSLAGFETLKSILSTFKFLD